VELGHLEVERRERHDHVAGKLRPLREIH
jgi:hypothetical protein